MVVAEFDGEHAADVVATLSGGLADTPVDVLDVGRVEFGNLRQCGGNHLARELVGADVLQGPLPGAADRGAGMGDNHGFRHVAQITGPRDAADRAPSGAGGYPGRGVTNGRKTSSTISSSVSSATGASVIITS